MGPLGEIGALFSPGMRHEVEERRSKKMRREEAGNGRDGNLRIDLESGVAVIGAGGAADQEAAEQARAAAERRRQELARRKAQRKAAAARAESERAEDAGAEDAGAEDASAAADSTAARRAPQSKAMREGR